MIIASGNASGQLWQVGMQVGRKNKTKERKKNATPSNYGRHDDQIMGDTTVSPII